MVALMKCLLYDQIVSFPYEFYPQNSGWHYLRLKDACETPAARDSIYIHVWSAPAKIISFQIKLPDVLH